MTPDQYLAQAESSTSTDAVSPQYLLEGSAYALQRAGSLLRDAAMLYRKGSYATAYALAVFGREEIGKHKLLLGLRRQAVEGKNISVKDVRNVCERHLTKGAAGTLSVTLRGD